MSEKYIFKCNVCGYLYDESKEKVSFADLNKHWLCPVCAVDKSEFSKMTTIKNNVGASNISCLKNQKHIVIVGSGYAGSNFAMELHTKSKSHLITMITQEKTWHYARPLLTRAFYSQELKRNMYIMKLSEMENENVRIIPGTEVTKIDGNKKTVTIFRDNARSEITYDELVLATGSDAFIPPNIRPFKDYFLVLNNLADYEKLLALKKNQKSKIALIGGGLIGCELASEFNKMGDDVHVFHLAGRIIENVLSEVQSRKLLNFLERQGIKFHLNYNVKQIEKRNDGYRLDDQDETFDLVLVAAGFSPRISVAMDGGVNCNRGIIVNSYLQTNLSSIFAIGDVAEISGKTYAYLPPINDQIEWLSNYLSEKTTDAFHAREYPVKIKIHDYETE